MGDAEQWLRAQAQERDDAGPGAVGDGPRLRHELAALDHRRDLVLADYQAALDAGDAEARIVLEVATRLDWERDALAARLADAEALAAEWEDVGDSGLTESVDLVRALARARRHGRASHPAMANAVDAVATPPWPASRRI